MASNQSGLQDEDGDRSDWIEIANRCESPQNIGGWHLTDDPSNLTRWKFPSLQLGKNQYLVVFASGKNRRDSASELHTNFKLRREGEFLALVEPNGSVLAAKFDTFPPQRTDVSYGLSHDENECCRYFQLSTPSSSNDDAAFNGIVSSVEMHVKPGGTQIFQQPQMVTLSTLTPGASIALTTNGTNPSLTNGRVVRAPNPMHGATVKLQIESTTVIRAVAILDDFLPSDVTTRTFLFPQDVFDQDHQRALDAGFAEEWGSVQADYEMDSEIVGPDDSYDGLYSNQVVDSLMSIPSVSLVLDAVDMFGEKGIYSNPAKRGRQWERPTSVEFLVGDGGGPNVQSDAGIRIHGGSSRNHSVTKKKSFRLTFRAEYGSPEFEASLFGTVATNRFKRLVLRAGFNDSWNDIDAENKAQYIRDEWFRRTQLAMGGVSAHGMFAHLYINGLYWGVYNIVERPDAAFSSAYSGGGEDEWDVISRSGPIDGTDEFLHALREQAIAVDADDRSAGHAAFQALLGTDSQPDVRGSELLLNVNGYIDYLILNFYGGRWDWPGNNWLAARRRGAESTGFQFYSWDAEFSLGLGANVETNRVAVDTGIADIFGHLRANRTFRRMFAARVRLHFSVGGVFYVDRTSPEWKPDAPERNMPAARYAELADTVELSMIAESARWGDQHRGNRPFLQADWLAERDRLLTSYLPQRSAVVLGQFAAAGLFPPLEAARLARAPSYLLSSRQTVCPVDPHHILQ